MKPGSRVAVVHDWLCTYSGAERVLEQILACFPDADLFTVADVLPRDQRGFLGGRPVRASFIQRLPFASKHFRNYLLLMPLAVEQFDLSGYDIVISSSWAVAKGVLTRPDQPHVSYVHTPIRYAWEFQHQYLRETGIDRGIRSWPARWMLHRLRMWDQRTANGVDSYVANSRYVAQRIRKTYRRDAEVVYPPVDVDAFSMIESKHDFYLIVARAVPYKRLDLAVRAFSAMKDRRLVVIGEGPEMPKLRALGAPNVAFLGYQPFDVVKEYMQRAKAFLFPGEEDFGIAPVEAQACGTPVIAFAKGGAAETVNGLHSESPTGVFFEAQTMESLIAAVEEFERERRWILPRDCRANSERFKAERFRKEFTAIVGREIESAGGEHSRPAVVMVETRHAAPDNRSKPVAAQS